MQGVGDSAKASAQEEHWHRDGTGALGLCTAKQDVQLRHWPVHPLFWSHSEGTIIKKKHTRHDQTLFCMQLKKCSWFSGHRCQGIHRKGWLRRHRWYRHGIPCPGWSRPNHYYRLVWWRETWQHRQRVRWWWNSLPCSWYIPNVCICDPVFVFAAMCWGEFYVVQCDTLTRSWVHRGVSSPP